MKKPYAVYAMTMEYLLLGLSLPLTILCSVSLAQPPITPSGLNTQVNLAPAPPPGKVQYDITGGTRPGGGANLFHSFGDFNVPNNNIANFLNNSSLATSNILGRVTGGNISNIFGTIQTTGFGNANLYLMNPTGFLFGPNATLNVGGMVSFTSADYLRLADGVRFNASPNASADALLSVAPVAAFGFLGSNPGAITVQGSQLTVAEGTGISLVGGDIAVQGGTLTAPSGQINLVSVGKPSNPHVAGEVVVASLGQGGGFNPTGFATLGAINLTQGSTVDASAIAGSGHSAGHVVIRGGEFVMDNSSIKAAIPASIPGGNGVGGTIEVTAEHVALSNHSSVNTNASNLASPGNITFNVDTLTMTDSAISSFRNTGFRPGEGVTIQGLQGSGASAQSVSLTNTTVNASAGGLGADGGPIVIRADNIALNHSTLGSGSVDHDGGPITLVSKGDLDIRNSGLNTHSVAFGGSGGPVNLKAGTSIGLTNTSIDAGSHNNAGSPITTITMAAPLISIRGSNLTVDSGTQGGTVLINAGAQFTSQQSTISAQSFDTGVGTTPGGTIHIEANKVALTDSLLTTSVTAGPQSVGGTITVDAKNTTLTNSQILSTATEGTGGTITINSNVLHQDPSTVIDASSQTGTNGTVTINGVIQP